MSGTSHPVDCASRLPDSLGSASRQVLHLVKLITQIHNKGRPNKDHAHLMASELNRQEMSSRETHAFQAFTTDTNKHAICEEISCPHSPETTWLLMCLSIGAAPHRAKCSSLRLWCNFSLLYDCQSLTHCNARQITDFSIGVSCSATAHSCNFSISGMTNRDSSLCAKATWLSKGVYHFTFTLSQSHTAAQSYVDKHTDRQRTLTVTNHLTWRYKCSSMGRENSIGRLRHSTGYTPSRNCTILCSSWQHTAYQKHINNIKHKRQAQTDQRPRQTDRDRHTVGLFLACSKICGPCHYRTQ